MLGQLLLGATDFIYWLWIMFACVISNFERISFVLFLWQSMVLKHPMQFWIYVLWSSCELPEAQVSSCFMSYAFHFVFMVNLLFIYIIIFVLCRYGGIWNACGHSDDRDPSSPTICGLKENTIWLFLKLILILFEESTNINISSVSQSVCFVISILNFSYF